MAPLGRRSLLRRTLAGLVTAGASGLAGCSLVADSGLTGTRTPYDVPARETTTDRAGSVDRTTTAVPDEFGPVDYPDPGSPTYRQWLPAPSTLVGEGSDNGRPSAVEASYPVHVVDLERIRRPETAVPASFDRHRQWGKLGLDAFGIGFDRYERVLRLGRPGEGVAVVEATFDPGTVASTLVETGYEPAGDHRGFALFARADGPRTVALGEGALVWSNLVLDPGGSSADDAVEAVVDARTGRASRYHEVHRSFDRASRAAGAPAWVWFVTGPGFLRQIRSREGFGEVGAFASSFDFDARATYWRNDYGFDHAIDQARVERVFRRYLPSTGMAQAATAVEVAVGAYTAQVAGVVPEDRYGEVFGPPSGATYPQITWGFDHERRGVDAAVTVTHQAGDRVPAEGVVVTTPERTLGSFARQYDRVGPGDSLTVTVATGEDGDEDEPTQIRVVWQDPAVGHRTVLRRYEVA